ncbi:MAG: phosphate ABC transporter substrate-binding protein PstS [Acetobacteraceae bacterium]|jgi:phosphate transport system substrate-binding protein
MRRSFAAMMVLCAMTASAAAQEIVGSGSTFCYPVMVKLIEAYARASGVQVLFQPTGSAAGMIDVQHRVVDFAVSEAPLDEMQLMRDGLSQFPFVIGAIVPVVNIDGVSPGQLRFTGRLLADIFLGKVTNWNDPAIAELNPDLKLPNLAILVIHRSDGSGTTYNWAWYLSTVSDEWKLKVGAYTSVGWPTGVGGKGNGGVAEKVARVRGAIGYVDQTYATSAKLAYGLVRNQAGNFVTPDTASFQAATANVDWSKVRDFGVLLANAPDPGAYPIMATSFVMTRKYPPDPSRKRDTLGFFRWALEHGQDLASSLGYLPLPPQLVRLVEDSWSADNR